jgi:DNA-binding transcriptional LysR family regulator
MSSDPWIGVELRHLAALAAVVKEESFRGAADRLGYVQSAISQQIGYLERRLGVRLLERTRGKRGVRATAAGEILLDHLDQILARMQAAQADLASFQNGTSGTVHVGIHEGLGARLVPAVLREFARRAPNFELVPIEKQSDAELFGLVEDGAIDVAFGDLPLEAGPFETCELLTDPCLLLVPASADLGQAVETPSFARIAEHRLIRYTGWRLMPAVEAQFRLHGVKPRFHLDSDCSATVQSLVSAGLGAAILPRLTIDVDDPEIRTVDLGTALPWHRVALYWHRERHHARTVEAFCEAAQAACRSEGFTDPEELSDRLSTGPEPERTALEPIALGQT